MRPSFLDPNTTSKDWTEASLGELCRIVGGSTPASGTPEYWNGHIVWVTPTDLGALIDTHITTSARRISQLGYDSCGTEISPPGAVVLSSRAPIGHLGIAGVPLCTNQGCKSFLPGPLIDSEFLFYALRFHVPDLQALGSGATFKEVSKSALEAFTISFPSLPEQRRIAARLREQMQAASGATRAAESRQRACNLLFFASLREAFLGITPLTADRSRDKPPSGWRWQKLSNIARLESGHTPSRYHPEWWGGDIPWLALPDIRALDGKEALETIENTNDLGIQNSSARVLPQGTVVLSRTASVGFVTVLGRPMATSQDFVNWVCGDELEPWFLAYLLMASRHYIRSLSSGAVHKTVYMPAARAFEVCVPAFQQQQSIAASLARAAAAADVAARGAHDCLNLLHSLPASLLRRAFSGGI